MKPVEIGKYTATSAAGIGLDALRGSIERRQTGLRPNDFPDCDIDTWIGRVDDLEAVELPAAARHLESRNNRLAWLALQQDTMLGAIDSLKGAVGVDRIGVIIGTSTSSIGRTEEAYRNLSEAAAFHPEFVQPQVHTLHSPGLFIATAAGLTGPAMTISSACSSSAKVFASGARWIDSGLADAVLVGGVDSLCLSTLYGFNSLDRPGVPGQKWPGRLRLETRREPRVQQRII
jgi:3-oxoacyl-[acyl-carrier-protein] synthase-1